MKKIKEELNSYCKFVAYNCHEGHYSHNCMFIVDDVIKQEVNI